MPLNKPRNDTLAESRSSSLRGASRGDLLKIGLSTGLVRGKHHHRVALFAILPTLCCLLVFCFSAPEAAAASEEVIYKPNQPLKPIVEQPAAAGETAKKDEKNYTYDPSGKTDPFKSFIAEQEEMAEKQKRKPRTYLETLDLSQLELIAIITGPKGNYAMVRDSKGVGHVILKGTSIGTNGGVVEKITDKEVVIREEYRDFKGAAKFKDVTKKLPSLM